MNNGRGRPLPLFYNIMINGGIQMKRFSLVLSILFSMGVLFTVNISTTQADQESISLIVDGNFTLSDVPPVIEDGRTLVPIRAVSDALRIHINWDNEIKLVSVNTTDTDISTPDIQRSSMVQLAVNGELIHTDVPPKIIDGRAMLPVRALAEALDASVIWDADHREVIVITPNYDSDQPVAPRPTTSSDAEAHYSQLQTPARITTEILESDDKTIQSAFAAIEQWISLVFGKDKETWIIIEESVRELMIEELKQHFTEEKANQLFNQYYVKKGDYYQFKEQGIPWRLHHDISNLIVEVHMHNANSKATVNLEGMFDDGGVDVKLNETFTLILDENTDNYLISEMIFIMP